MITLVDNTLMHRVGVLLEASPGTRVSSSDALAIFHLAENVLFANKTVVSSFERPSTNERTLKILNILSSHGISHGDDEQDIFKVEPFTKDSYAIACHNAASGICEDLALLDASELSLHGRLADQRTRPSGVPVPPFNEWISNHGQSTLEEERRNALLSLRAKGAFELITLDSPAVRNSIQALRCRNGKLSKAQQAALSVIFRLNINQELSKHLSGLYSPAPQRARVAARSERLFRNRLERIIQDVIIEKQEKATPEILLRLMAIQALPLPLFALRLLADSKARNPRDLIECARNLRDREDIIEVRQWLCQWEEKLKESDQSWSAITELSKWRDDLVTMIECKEESFLSILRPGIEFKTDLVSGSQSISLKSFSAKDVVDIISRRIGKQRMFIAATAKRVLSDANLGKSLLAKLGMSISMD